MASADFSQFVVTTVNETACETSPVKVRTLSLHAPTAFTRTSSNFWTSVPFATLSVFPSLICGSYPLGQRFAYSFFQIPSHGGHPCCSAMCFVVAYAHSGPSPVRVRPCWANKSGQKRSRYSSIFILIHELASSSKIWADYFFKYLFASLKKLPTINNTMIPIGNAATILTDCKLFIELSENTNAIGSIINRIHHIN